MRRKCLLVISTLLFAVGILFLWDQTASRLYAQQADEPKMPEVIMLGADAKLGGVKFNHVKHNGGTYTIDQSKTIACVACHHTAQPKSEVEKHPPLKTAWPADRTTTLTAELFLKDPKGAGVVACRDCHARQDTKPKLLDKIPEVKHEGSTALIALTNMQALHRNCIGCHVEVKKTVAASKGPVQAQCAICHKKAA
ncbi:MAG: cytochrome c3 family protein [Pyrinomonadaceae bacterium]